MAFCGQCGQKNPDGAKFCSACGSPLATSVDATDSRSQETPSKSERIILHRESAPPPPPRRDSTSQSRRETGNLWQDMNRNRDRQSRQEEPSRRERGYEKPAKKGGTFGGCLKRLLWWIVGIAVVMFALLWAIGHRSGDGGIKGGNDENIVEIEKDTQDPSTFERMMSPTSADSLGTVKGFPKTTDDVAPLGGEYVGSAGEYVINITLKPAQNGKVVGNVVMSANGYKAVREGVYCYCGNSIYAIYKYEDHVERNKVQNYFFAMPDRKSIMMIDGEKYILERKDPPPVQKGKGSGTLLSRNYMRCMTDDFLKIENEDFGYPIKDEDTALQFGTYVAKIEAKGEMHTVTYVLEPYDGENLFIVAKATGHADEDLKYTQDFYFGYCGHGIYAIYKYDEDDVGLLKSPKGLLYAASDGKSFGVWDKGKSMMEFKLEK